MTRADATSELRPARDEVATGTLPPERETAHPSAGRAFRAVLLRDIYVTGRELPSFLAQVLIQPFFFLLVFVVVLGRSGLISPEYGSIMLPGLIALNAMFGALQAVTLPLVFELSWTREIDDRLLAPMPVWAVAMEKVVFASLRGLIAALLMVPIGIAMVHVTWPASGLLPAFVMVALGALLGAAIGLTLGTAVPPRRINVIFAVVFTPLLFTGSVQYPWPSLGDLPWFQVVSAINPLTYVSEGLRGWLVPAVPHMPLWLCFLVPVLAIGLFSVLGSRGFLRRALD